MELSPADLKHSEMEWNHYERASYRSMTMIIVYILTAGLGQQSDVAKFMGSWNGCHGTSTGHLKANQRKYLRFKKW